MIRIDEKTLTDLAHKYAPVLRFHQEERFFPLLVESWLTTTTIGLWPEAADQQVGSRTRPTDDGRHGAAVCLADAAMATLQVLAGPPIEADRPLSLGGDPADPYSLLSSLVSKEGIGAFLNVGGWDSTDFRAGDLDYLVRLCSELGSAMNPTLDWSPPQNTTPIPWSWVAQPTHPTIYCEISWAGSYPRVCQTAGKGEFPPEERSFDDMVAFTYHLFYGARTPPSEESGGRISEGQWEAITLYFRAKLGRGGQVGNSGEHQVWTVGSGSISEEPWAVVISQGQDRSAGSHWTAMRDFTACERLGDSPVIYVAKGTHRNYFEPVEGQTFDPGRHGPHGPDSTPHNNEGGTWTGVDGFLASAGMLLGVSALLAAALPVLVAAGVGLAAIIAATAMVVAIIFAIVLFIMWIVSACTEASDADAGEEVSFGGESDEAGGGGPQSGGDGSEEGAAPGQASGGSPTGSANSGTGPDATGTVGLANSGSPTGRSSAFPDIRIVERLLRGGASESFSTFPSRDVLENPPWWSYRGRWGVRVKPAPAGGTWESGWHRVDEVGRDWGYFNTERLLIAMNNGPRQSN